MQDLPLEEISSERRNPVLADVMAQLDLMEKRGSGLRRIMNETRALDGYKDELKPAFRSTTSQFITIIYSTQYESGELNGQLNGQLNDSQKETLEYIIQHQGCNTTAIANGLDKPFRTIDKHVSVLLKQKLIERRGSKKTGGYYPLVTK